MATEQSAQSHAKFDPLFHFVLAPLFLANFIVQIVHAVRAWPIASGMHFWNVVVALGFLLLTFMTRQYGLSNQDRIIRLEERLRVATLVSTADAQRLTTRQLIALRFASDAELSALVRRTLTENLDPKTIKQSIATWRPDHHRI